jgi:hypothetical protein
MRKRWRWNERTRLLLTLELAVVLPAAALVIVNFVQLEKIHRDHAIEALMQRDFAEALVISEKRINEKATPWWTRCGETFPNPRKPVRMNSTPYSRNILTWPTLSITARKPA